MVDSTTYQPGNDPLIAYAQKLGGAVSRVTDLETGEIEFCAPSRGREEHERRASLAGLSNVHISSRVSRLTIWKGGGLVKVSRPVRERSGQAEPAKRGQVAAMSRASRRRLMYKLGTIKRDVTPIFSTLTYPGLFTGDVKSCKRNFDAIAHRMDREGIACLWRLEFKVRKSGESEGEVVPHFHLLVWLPNGMTVWEFQRWLSRAWYEVVGSGSADHLAAGTSCEKMRSWRGVMSYAAKYICKEDLDAVPAGCGRQWGVVNRDLIPWAEIEQEVISDRQCYQAFKLFVAHVGFEMWREECPSRSILVDDPEMWRKVILKL